MNETQLHCFFKCCLYQRLTGAINSVSSKTTTQIAGSELNENEDSVLCRYSSPETALMGSSSQTYHQILLSCNRSFISFVSKLLAILTD